MNEDDDYDLRQTIRFEDMDLDEEGPSGPDEWLRVLDGPARDSTNAEWERLSAVVNEKGALELQLPPPKFGPGDHVEIMVRVVKGD